MRIVEPSVELLWVTPDSEKSIEVAGRTCYKSLDKMTDESAGAFIKRIIKSGHESVLEHCTAQFRIITTRFTTHQIVRHRLFSYSQESQRYCNYSKDKFNNEISYVKPLGLTDQPDSWTSEWEYACIQSEKSYFAMIGDGVPPQVARSILPSSCKTEIVMTGNFRNWRHFLKLRCDSHAQDDVRSLANQIKSDLINVAPNVFS